MDLLPGAVEDAAVARLVALLDGPAEAVLAGGGLDAASVTTEAQLAVALGRTLAPIDLTLALLAQPRARVSLAVPRPSGGHVCFGSPDADVVLVWDDDGIGVASGFEAHEVVECLDPATPMAFGILIDPGPRRAI